LSLESSFDRFVVDNQRRIWQSLVPLVGPEAAQDALAEALARAWTDWPRVSSMANPSGYVYTVARNEAIRGERPAPAFALAEPLEAQAEPGLVDALRELTEMQRQAVYLLDGVGWTLQEVADHLGVAVSTVRNHRQRGLDRLRRRLKVVSDA